MIREITCIECPVGCKVLIEIEGGKIMKISGHKCPKGEEYAVSEIENPMRVLTSTVATENLPIKMLPVRTDGPIPKARIFEAMDEIKRLVMKKPVAAGDAIVKNFLNLNVNLVATRSSS